MKFTVAMKQNWLLKKIPNTKYFEVRESFIWLLDYSNKKEKIIILKWFKTDFWTIPRLLRIFFNPTRYISYVLHDWGYSKYNVKYSRKQIDLMLLEALNVEWASMIEKSLVYLGVRMFWWIKYKK